MSCKSSVSGRELQHSFVDIAPSPIFAGLNRPGNSVLCAMKMLCGMFSRRRIAAANVAAKQAHPQMNPVLARFQTLFAAVSMRLYIVNLIEMGTTSHMFYFETVNFRVRALS